MKRRSFLGVGLIAPWLLAQGTKALDLSEQEARRGMVIVGLPDIFDDGDNRFVQMGAPMPRHTIVRVNERAAFQATAKLADHHPFARLQNAASLQKVIGIGARHTFLPNPNGARVQTYFLQMTDVFPAQRFRRDQLTLAQGDENELRLHPMISPRMLHFARQEKLIAHYPIPDMRQVYPIDPARRAFYAGREWSYTDMRKALESARGEDEFWLVTDGTGDPVMAVLPARPKA